MIVVVEGIDRVGKTTLVNKLVDAGFFSLKDEFILPKGLIDSFPSYSIGKCDSFLAIAKQLEESGHNIVIDRLHLTELVYGTIDRHSVDEKSVWALDMKLADMGALLVYVHASNLSISNELAGRDQMSHSIMFMNAFRKSSMNKLTTDYDTLDSTYGLILEMSTSYDFYFASPFFNDEQVEREERMIAHLRKLGFKVFSPKESCKLDAKASQNSRAKVFNDNCNAISKAKAVFAVTDGKDMGTIWETGYAYGINKPVVYYAETLGDNQFNLMLAQSGRDVFTSQKEVTAGALLEILHGSKRKFRGDIE